MPNAVNEVDSDGGRFIFEQARPVTEGRVSSGSVGPIDRLDDVAEGSPSRRRAEATPYDLKLEILGKNIRDMRRDDGHLEDVAEGLYKLAEKFIEILEKRERWTHFYSNIPMPCPEFLIPPVETDVED